MENQKRFFHAEMTKTDRNNKHAIDAKYPIRHNTKEENRQMQQLSSLVWLSILSSPRMKTHRDNSTFIGNIRRSGNERTRKEIEKGKKKSATHFLSDVLYNIISIP